MHVCTSNISKLRCLLCETQVTFRPLVFLYCRSAFAQYFYWLPTRSPTSIWTCCPPEGGDAMDGLPVQSWRHTTRSVSVWKISHPSNISSYACVLQTEKHTTKYGISVSWTKVVIQRLYIISTEVFDIWHPPPHAHRCLINDIGVEWL